MSVRETGPFVHRPSPSVQWNVVHHWGTLISDDTTYQVTRTKSGIEIYDGKVRLHLRDEVMRQVVNAAVVAVDWDLDQPACRVCGGQACGGACEQDETRAACGSGCDH